MDKKMDKKNNLIWIDLEMSGLDLKKDVILEIASVITDSNLEVIEQGPHFVIGQPENLLASMEKEVVQMHKKSGLLEMVKKSTTTIEQAEQDTLAFFKKHCDPDTALLAGNSVWQDRNFLYFFMPTLVDYCYYRLLDVTAIKEVVCRWYPDSPYNEFKKKETHRALDDILESIEELRHLRKYFFIK